jgi:DNA-binding response OmpR family regulator
LIAETLFEYEVDFALTADDAVQLAHSRTYALYFLDPAVCGFHEVDLLTELHYYDPCVPLIICTSSDRTLPLPACAAAHIHKPLRSEVIRNTATRVLRGDSAAVQGIERRQCRGR